MPIRVTCPYCNEESSLPDDKRGQDVTCPKCEIPISVPQSAPAVGPSAPPKEGIAEPENVPVLKEFRPDDNLPSPTVYEESERSSRFHRSQEDWDWSPSKKKGSAALVIFLACMGVFVLVGFVFGGLALMYGLSTTARREARKQNIAVREERAQVARKRAGRPVAKPVQLTDKAIELRFRPPVIWQGNHNKKVNFEVSVKGKNVGDLFNVHMTLIHGRIWKTHKMKHVKDGVYRASAVPLGHLLWNTKLSITATFAEGKISGDMADRTVKLDGKPLALSQIRSVRLAQTEVQLANSQRRSGKLTGHEKIEIEVGGMKLPFDLSKAREFTISAPNANRREQLIMSFTVFRAGRSVAHFQTKLIVGKRRPVRQPRTLVVLSTAGNLVLGDARENDHFGKFYDVFSVRMKRNRIYYVDMYSWRFTPYLRLRPAARDRQLLLIHRGKKALHGVRRASLSCHSFNDETYTVEAMPSLSGGNGPYWLSVYYYLEKK